MVTRLTFHRLLFIVIVLAVPVTTRAQRSQPTFLGVVDGKGRLTPIAVNDGDTWWNRWPWSAESDEIRNLRVPTSLAAIPSEWLPPGVRLPVTWRAFPPSGQSVPFHALVPERPQEAAMMSTVVIRTTYRGPGAEPSNGGEDILAISGPGILGRIVTPSTAEGDAIIRQFDGKIAAVEGEALARFKTESGANGDKEIALTRTYMIDDATGVRYVNTRPRGYRDFVLSKATTPGGAESVYYLRSEKLYHLRKNDECMLNLATDGFVVASAGGKVLSDGMRAHAYDGYCGDPAEMLFPLATVTIRGHMWWVVKNSLEDGYDYGLLDTSTAQQIDLQGLWELRNAGRSSAPR